MATVSHSELLERGRELALLTGAWQAASRGHGSLWFLVAEAGGGKTQLARTVVDLVGVTALWGEAEPVSPPEPYFTLTTALPGFVPTADRSTTIKAALDRLTDLAQNGPLLLVLDDLHFADEGTVAYLVRLARECARRRWLVLATLRPGEGSTALHLALTETVAQGQAERLDLAPLSSGAVAELVARTHPTAPSAEHIAAIFRDGGGNPWFTVALARGGSALTAAKDRLRLRLDQVERRVPGAAALLAALAPAAHPLSVAVLEALTETAWPALRTVLIGLREAGILHEREDGAWGYRHDLLRRSVLEGMLSADQRAAHGALAAVLVRLGGRATELAMHFALAGDARAADWGVRAAKEAAQAGAWVEALAQVERALSFAMFDDERREALRVASLACSRLGQVASSRRYAEQGLQLPGGAPEFRSLLHQRAANAARLLGDGAAAAAHMDAAEQALAGQPPSFQMGYLAAGRVLQAAVTLDPIGAATAAARANAIIDQLPEDNGSLRLRLEVKAFQLVSILDQGDPQGLRDVAELERYAGLDPRPSPDLATTLINAYAGAVVALFSDAAAALEQRTQDFLARYELGGAAQFTPYRLLDLVQRGRFADARSMATGVTAPAAGSTEQAVLLCARALLEARAGSLAEAQRLVVESEQLTPARARFLTALARLELSEIVNKADFQRVAVEAYARAERRRFARTAAVAAVALARSGNGAPPLPSWLSTDAPLQIFWRWAAALAIGDAAALGVIAEYLSALRCPYEAALALRDADRLADAYRAMTSLGLTTPRTQLADQMRRAGIPLPRRTRASVEANRLTPTESDVCRLVAEGKRNDVIATTLGVSVRTVESHLARIYEKTAQRGRVALATWWRDQYLTESRQSN